MPIETPNKFLVLNWTSWNITSPKPVVARSFICPAFDRLWASFHWKVIWQNCKILRFAFDVLSMSWLLKKVFAVNCLFFAHIMHHEKDESLLAQSFLGRLWNTNECNFPYMVAVLNDHFRRKLPSCRLSNIWGQFLAALWPLFPLNT